MIATGTPVSASTGRLHSSWQPPSESNQDHTTHHSTSDRRVPPISRISGIRDREMHYSVQPFASTLPILAEEEVNRLCRRIVRFAIGILAWQMLHLVLLGVRVRWSTAIPDFSSGFPDQSPRGTNFCVGVDGFACLLMCASALGTHICAVLVKVWYVARWRWLSCTRISSWRFTSDRWDSLDHCDFSIFLGVSPTIGAVHTTPQSVGCCCESTPRPQSLHTGEFGSLPRGKRSMAATVDLFVRGCGFWQQGKMMKLVGWFIAVYFWLTRVLFFFFHCGRAAPMWVA